MDELPSDKPCRFQAMGDAGVGDGRWRFGSEGRLMDRRFVHEQFAIPHKASLRRHGRGEKRPMASRRLPRRFHHRPHNGSGLRWWHIAALLLTGLIIGSLLVALSPSLQTYWRLFWLWLRVHLAGFVRFSP